MSTNAHSGLPPVRRDQCSENWPETKCKDRYANTTKHQFETWKPVSPPKPSPAQFRWQQPRCGCWVPLHLRSLPYLLVRQESPMGLMNCKVFIVIIGQKSCSQLCGWREQSCQSKPEAANARAVVSRELNSASLSISESGQPFRRGEASTGPEALTKSKGRTLRGERRQRAQTEPPGTWEARHSRLAARRKQPPRRSHNPGVGSAAASERPIVAGKFRLQSGWSQGALAKVMLSQKPLELIG